MNSSRWIRVSLFVMASCAALVIFRVLLLQLMPWASGDNVSIQEQTKSIRKTYPNRAHMETRDGAMVAESVVSRHLFVDPEFMFFQC